MHRSRYLHCFDDEGRTVAFHSVTLESWILDEDERRAIDRPEEAAPSTLRDLLEAGLLVAEPEEPGAAIARINAARTRRFHERRGRFSTLRIALTERCNMACTYCFQQALYPDSQPRMTPEIFEEQMGWFLDQGDGHVTIQYFGGEPMLEWTLLRRGDAMLREAVARGSISSFRQTMTTNGTVLNPDRAKWLIEHDFDLIFSFDGPPEVNDKLRVFRNGRGSFDKAANGLRTWTAASGRGGILMTATELNLPHLAEYTRWFLDESGLDIELVALNSPQPTTDGWETGGALLADIVFEMWAACRERGVEFHGPGTFIPLHLKDRVPQSDNCVDGDLHGGGGGAWPIYVSASGQRSLCLVHHNDHRVIAAPSTAASQGHDWHLRAPSVMDCDSCIASQFCGGPCTLEKLLWKGALSNDRCEFMRTMTRHVLTRG